MAYMKLAPESQSSRRFRVWGLEFSDLRTWG